MTNQINDYIKYLFEDCYQEDYNPFYAESWCDNYCYDYTFSEWYFLLRKRLIAFSLIFLILGCGLI
jgi:hypothetical protein